MNLRCTALPILLAVMFQAQAPCFSDVFLPRSSRPGDRR